MLLYFFATYAVLVISFNLPFLIQQYKLTSSASGVMISLFFLAIMLPGLAVDRVIALLGKKTMFVSLLLIGAGLLLLYLMKSEFFVALGCFATGLGYGVIQPVVYNKAVVTASRERTTLALALVMSVNYLAILLCPFIVDMFARFVSVLFVGRFPVFAECVADADCDGSVLSLPRRIRVRNDRQRFRVTPVGSSFSARPVRTLLP